MREVREAFRRFWPLTRGDRRWPAVIVACVVVSAPAETASILLFAELTDHALKAGSLSAFWGPAGAWPAVAVLGALVGFLGNALATWTAEKFVLRLRASVPGLGQVRGRCSLRGGQEEDPRAGDE
jgi:ATP-binding cassette subfamily B protein